MIAAPLPLILASTSRYRVALLSRLGLPSTAVAPAYEEEHDLPMPPSDLVAYLARRKAESLQSHNPRAVIIGSDQAVAFAGDLLGKPGTPAAAEAQLARLAGHTHELLTGLCVLAPDGRIWERVETVRLTMRPLSAAQIARYVAADQPVDCAGSYKIEQLGIALFSAVDGRDPTAIEGLPLMALVGILAAIGLDPLTP
ncbi:MAG: septum formation protein Maf [Candidatus Sericytochromatia bacterium]|nr:septum formation protein Maf [Candidatus Sericytochromatia bacterium]